MSKLKLRTTTEVCADCSTPDPSWTSVNHGVYICNDCAGVHRNMGRHISQVKHLHRSMWHQNQLNMVHQLALVSANSIWEHSLLDPAQMRGGKRKPNASDPVQNSTTLFKKSNVCSAQGFLAVLDGCYSKVQWCRAESITCECGEGRWQDIKVVLCADRPMVWSSLTMTDTSSTKNDFIRAKYEQLVFLHRPRRADGDIGKQLHSSVRTANLDTSLRLLSLGANPNFFHTEKGNTPLHVAAKAGQPLQVELLVTYGADPAAQDANRLTPEDLARREGHNDLADRLVELQYELSDKLSNFVWGLKPDHKQNNHYAMPKSRDNGVGLDGRKRLQALSNQIFEELAMDVYDEVDRRENEKIWQEMKHSGGKLPPTADHVAVPFLTVNPEYSTTRNQGRQKLARFGQQEFAVLITDILYDIIRRQTLGNGFTGLVNAQQTKDEEDPIYDLPPDGSLDYQSIENSAAPPVAAGSSVPFHEFIALKKKLVERDVELNKLTEINRDLSHKVTNLAKHNHELLKLKQPPALGDQSAVGSASSIPPHSNLSPRSGSTNSLLQNTSSVNSNNSCDAPSLASVDVQLRRRTMPGGAVPNIPSHGSFGHQETNAVPENSPHPIQNGSSHNSVASEYDNNVASGQDIPQKQSCGSVDGSTDKTAQKCIHNISNNNNVVMENLQSHPSSPLPPTLPPDPEAGGDAEHVPDSTKQLPTADEVIRKTETVTKNIQNLLQAAQKSKIDSYLKCSENIFIAVREIVALFPACTKDEEMSAIISRLGAGAKRLRDRCQEVTELGLAVNSKQVTEEIIKNAYDIAKAEKELVTLTTRIQSENRASSAT